MPLLMALAALFATSFTKPFHKDDWQALFNGKDLDGWDTYIGPPLDDAGRKLSDVPVGLNNDPEHVFTVVDDNGKKVIRISGENWGGISTKKRIFGFSFATHVQMGCINVGAKEG
jgi:hypothetical protein